MAKKIPALNITATNEYGLTFYRFYDRGYNYEIVTKDGKILRIFGTRKYQQR